MFKTPILLAIVFVWFCSCFPGAFAAQRLTFVGVAIDVETRQADRKLQDYLHRKAEVSFAPEELEYGRVIDRLANWDMGEGPYLARTTPYVYVIAEMLGAEFEILATYKSAATEKTTYRSYLVVNRAHFSKSPSLPEVIDFLAKRESPARFAFHNKLSTSSFFLPSLYFRSNKIFNMDEPTESLIALRSAQIDKNSSTQLVKLVAEGGADLAAVWDGTKAKFHEAHKSGLYQTHGSKVYFIPLPTSIPNDLLVCSASLDLETKQRLRLAIENMPAEEIGEGDFLSWSPIKEATDARAALAGLRWMARERVAPVTVEVRLKTLGQDSPQGAIILESVYQALRFSGTEFVLFDQDYHEHIDFRWTLEVIHDGALVLESAIPGTGVQEQLFPLSFRDIEDLTQRIVGIIRSKMHRVRYVWPYSVRPPIVIRDLAASLSVGSKVKVQKIEWLDPERNSFRAGRLFDTHIHDSGFHKYELDPNDFAGLGDQAFDPMSNISYRVFLLQSQKEKPIFRIVTGVLLLLLVAAGVGAGVDIARRKRSGTPSSTAETRTTL